MDAFSLAPLIVTEYEGETSENGRYHGQGKATFNTGHKYSGGFQNGFMDGNGVYSWVDGVQYMGEFKKNNIQGTGTYSWTNGCQYNGEVKNGLKDGTGTFNCLPQKVDYVGEWKTGSQNGKGTMKYGNESSQYSGEWANGIKQGYGTMIYSSGNSYEGEWQNNIKHGKGKMVWKDRNEEYVGDWKDGLPNGTGKYTWFVSNKSVHQFPGHNIYEGEWLRGMRHGYGVFTYATGARYEGGWLENVKHGQGYYISENGRRYVGTFENDIMMGSFPKFQNESPFQFRVKKKSETTTPEEIKSLNNVALRYIDNIRSVYQKYSRLDIPDDNKLESSAMTKIQFWKLLTDAGLKYQGFPLVSMNRVYSKIYQNDTIFMNRAQNPHCPNERFILYDFLEALIQISNLVYGNRNDLSIHEHGMAATFNHLVRNDIVDKLCKETNGKENFVQKFELDLLKKMTERFQDRVFALYDDISKSSKSSLIECPGDKTVTIRSFLFMLHDYKLLEPENPLTIQKVITIFSDQLPAVAEGGSYNLEYELVSLEVFEALFRCFIIKNSVYFNKYLYSLIAKENPNEISEHTESVESNNVTIVYSSRTPATVLQIVMEIPEEEELKDVVEAEPSSVKTPFPVGSGNTNLLINTLKRTPDIKQPVKDTKIVDLGKPLDDIKELMAPDTPDFPVIPPPSPTEQLDECDRIEKYTESIAKNFEKVLSAHENWKAFKMLIKRIEKEEAEKLMVASEVNLELIYPITITTLTEPVINVCDVQVNKDAAYVIETTIMVEELRPESLMPSLMPLGRDRGKSAGKEK